MTFKQRTRHRKKTNYNYAINIINTINTVMVGAVLGADSMREATKTTFLFVVITVSLWSDPTSEAQQRRTDS